MQVHLPPQNRVRRLKSPPMKWDKHSTLTLLNKESSAVDISLVLLWQSWYYENPICYL